jgi:peroxiredoxin
VGGEDTLTARDPVLSAIAGQRALEGERAPGFWLRDGRGRLVGLDDFRGRAVALGFWGPGDPESLRLLSTFEELARSFGPRGLTCIAVCLDRDSASAGPFAREHPDLVVLWDRGQHYGDGERWSDSPLAIAYEVREVPVVFLLDRERTYLSRVEGHSLETLEATISRLLGAAGGGEPARLGGRAGAGRQGPRGGARAPAMRGR